LPEVIGGYELVRPLGRGGMAEVWLARKTVGEKGSKYVALKLIAEHFLGDERYVRMFRAEAELAAVLNHANIVQVFDEGVEDGRSYLVMEWVDGLNLLKLGERLAFVDEQRRYRLASYIIGQLLHALHYAHCIRSVGGHPLGVVHRDVSPQNVLVSNNGEVKLTDFGVAHHNFEESSGMHIKGKVRYMPPEQLTGQSRSPTVDLYAVGALLHELVDGRKFRGAYEDGQDLFTVVLTGQVPPLARPAPPRLDQLRLRLLERDPKRRIQTAEDALALLARVPGYGDARDELRKLCGSATGVVHPRVGPGQSSPQAAAEHVTEPRRGCSPLGKPMIEPPGRRPPPPPPPPPPASSRPVTGSLTAVKDRDGARPGPGAWITGNTEHIPLPAHGIDFLPSLEPRSSSGTEQELVPTEAVGDGSVTQHDRLALPPAKSRSQELALRRSVFVLLGLLPLVAAGSIGASWWLFSGGREGETTEEPRSTWTWASLLSSTPIAAVRGVALEATPVPVDSIPNAAALERPTAAAASIDAHPETDDVDERGEPPTPSAVSSAKAIEPAPRKVVVRVMASSALQHAQVRLGSQSFSADAHAHKITSGTRAIKWRRSPSEAWRSAGKWSFKPGKGWIIHINKNGPHIRREP
jgi:serine/threonine protein kinase